MNKEERRIVLGAISVFLVAVMVVVYIYFKPDKQSDSSVRQTKKVSEMQKSENSLTAGELTTVNSQGGKYERSGQVKQKEFPWAISQGEFVYLIGYEKKKSGNLQIYRENKDGKNREKKLELQDSGDRNIGKMICDGRWLVMSYSTDRGVKKARKISDYRQVDVAMELQKGVYIVNLDNWSVVDHPVGGGQIPKNTKLSTLQDFSIKGDILYYTYEYFDSNLVFDLVLDYKAAKEYGRMEMEERRYHHGGRAEYSMTENKYIVNERNYGVIWSLLYENRMLYRDKSGNLFLATLGDDKGRDTMQMIYKNDDLSVTFFTTISLLGIRDGNAYYSQYNKESHSVDTYCFESEKDKLTVIDSYNYESETAKEHRVSQWKMR